MKNLILLLLILSSINLYSQNYEITYEMNLQNLDFKDNEKTKSKMDSIYKLYGQENSNKIKVMTEKFLNALTTNKVYLNLTISNSLSKFEAKKELGDINLNTILSHAISEKGIYYQDLQNSNLFRTTTYKGLDFTINDKVEKNWEITSEKKNILGKECIKAVSTLKPNTFAWYTPEIKTPAGPAEYGGLDGLILELIQGEAHYTAIEIKKLDSEPKIKIPKKGRVVTMEEYNKMVKESEKE